MFGVRREMLCVTDVTLGEISGRRLSVNVPKMRAYVNRWTSQAIEADFTYFGTTGNEARLGSGEMRRQFGEYGLVNFISSANSFSGLSNAFTRCSGVKFPGPTRPSNSVRQSYLCLAAMIGSYLRKSA